VHLAAGNAAGWPPRLLIGAKLPSPQGGAFSCRVCGIRYARPKIVILQSHTAYSRTANSNGKISMVGVVELIRD
jgi:hypothetical protein